MLRDKLPRCRPSRDGASGQAGIALLLCFLVLFSLDAQEKIARRPRAATPPARDSGLFDRLRQIVFRDMAFRLGVKAFVDSNLVARSPDETLLAGLDDERDRGLFPFASAVYRAPWSDPWKVQLQYSIAQMINRREDDLEAQYHLPGVVVGRPLSLPLWNAPAQVDLSYQLSYIRLDGEDLQLRQSWRPGLTVEESQRLSSRLHYQYTLQEVFRRNDTPQEDADGYFQGFGATQSFQVPTVEGLSVSAGFSRQWNNLEGHDLDAVRDAWSASAQWRFADLARIEYSISYNEAHHRHKNSRTGFQNRRDDHGAVQTISLPIRLGERYFLTPQVSRTNQESDVEVFPYRRAIYTLSFAIDL